MINNLIIYLEDPLIETGYFHKKKSRKNPKEYIFD
jgi:hypothetical protein